MATHEIVTLCIRIVQLIIAITAIIVALKVLYKEYIWEKKLMKHSRDLSEIESNKSHYTVEMKIFEPLIGSITNDSIQTREGIVHNISCEGINQFINYLSQIDVNYIFNLYNDLSSGNYVEDPDKAILIEDGGWRLTDRKFTYFGKHLDESVLLVLIERVVFNGKIIYRNDDPELNIVNNDICDLHPIINSIISNLAWSNIKRAHDLGGNG